MSTDPHTRLRAAIEARLEITHTTAAAKPGKWIALPLHDGTAHTGYSGVRTEEPTPTGRRSSPVAAMMADTLGVQRSSLANTPEPAAVARYVALHDPSDEIRRYERDLKVLDRHRVEVNPDGSPNPWCTCGSDYYDTCDEITDLAGVYPEVSDVD